MEMQEVSIIMVACRLECLDTCIKLKIVYPCIMTPYTKATTEQVYADARLLLGPENASI
jgi:hypothetical protein